MARDKEPRDNDRKERPLSKGSKRKAGTALSDEERALWEHAARDLKPLKSAKGRVRSGEREAEPSPPRTQEKPAKPQHSAARKAVAQPKPEPRVIASPPPLTSLDRRTARRIEVEARIDLHGMRQAEAHAALRRFLLQSHASGRRWVLVITGKGTGLHREPERDDDLAGYGGEERGVLRRNVPRWLAEPDLRSIVVGFASAAIRHGGEGALYVQLRRRDRSTGSR